MTDDFGQAAACGRVTDRQYRQYCNPQRHSGTAILKRTASREQRQYNRQYTTTILKGKASRKLAELFT
jgi:uncharacterized cupin superfamily protein